MWWYFPIYTSWYDYNIYQMVYIEKKIPKFFFIVLKFSPGKDDQKCIYICICSPIFQYKKINIYLFTISRYWKISSHVIISNITKSIYHRRVNWYWKISLLVLYNGSITSYNLMDYGYYIKIKSTISSKIFRWPWLENHIEVHFTQYCVQCNL